MRVAFLDRDGVINREKNYVYKIADFEYIPRSIEGLKNLISLGYKLIIVTNQAGIARGLYSKKSVETLHNWLIEDLARHRVEILDILFCPHHPDGTVPLYSIECECRKPKPAMLNSAQVDYDIEMHNSILVGDKASDICAGKRAGIENLFLVRSGHAIDNNELKDVPIFADLFAVSNYLSG
jgi:D-glycero-D-manno-heptose 1,7-bisphosphate phosphatase